MPVTSKNRLTAFAILFCLISINPLGAIDDEGLKLYREKQFENAKQYYEQILLERKKDSYASYGLGASVYNQGDYDVALTAFEETFLTEDQDLKASAYFNMGNTLYQQQRLEESLAFYRKALELKPADLDSKFNYELVKYNQQKQNQQQSPDGGNQKDQQERDQKQPDQNQQNQDQSKQPKPPDKKRDQEHQQPSEDQEEQQSESKSSPEKLNAESILNALKNDERIHQKLKMAQQQSRKLEKDW
jgi:tetratricopeptide (TPR) repeat protein